MKFAKSKKGVTLLELSITLFLLAIVSASVVTFSILITKRVDANNDKLSFMQDVIKTEEVASFWLDEVYSLGGEVLLEEGNLVSTIGGESYFIKFIDGNLQYTLPDKDNSLALSVVSGITFSIKEKEGDELYFCSLSYSFSEGKEEKYLFTINPKVGEVISLSNGGGL